MNMRHVVLLKHLILATSKYLSDTVILNNLEGSAQYSKVL